MTQRKNIKPGDIVSFKKKEYKERYPGAYSVTRVVPAFVFVRTKDGILGVEKSSIKKES